jgi:hypothetical protein
MSGSQRRVSPASRDSSDPAPVSPAHANRFTALATPAHYLSLAVAFALLLYFARVTWFKGDEFGFFARMQPGQSVNLLTPYYEQWSTVPLMITQVLYTWVGLHSILPYNLWMLLAHVTLAHILWRWMRRIGADPWVATALTAVFLVVRGGILDATEEFWYWQQVTFTMSLIFGFLAVLVIDHDGPSDRRDFAFWLLAILSLMSSDVGVFMVMLGGLVALLRRGPVAALRVVCIPTLVFLAWLVLIADGAPSATPTPRQDLPLLLQYVWTGISQALIGATGWGDAGIVLFAVLVVWMYRERHLAGGPQALAFAAVAVAPVFFFGTGVARIAIGTVEAASARFGYVCIALLLPASALALSRISLRSPRLGRGLVLAATGAWTLNGIAGLGILVQSFTPFMSTTMRATTLGAAQLVATEAPLAVGETDALPYGPSVELLRSMLKSGAFPTELPVSRADRLDAAVYFQVSLTPTALVEAAVPPAVLPAYRTVVRDDGGGCISPTSITGQPQVGLSFGSPASVELVSGASGSSTFQLAWVSSPTALTPVQSLPIPQGDIYLNVTAAGTIALLTLPAGTYRLCGVTMASTPGPGA